jgi:ribosomal protein S18 acetylase RimI-like enzyme
MPDFHIRPTLASDLPRLMALEHSVSSDSVWQLELRRETGQLFATFREVRLPRPINLTYPHDPFALADEWKSRSAVFSALVGTEPIGYLALVQSVPESIIRITDLVVEPRQRRQGVGSALFAAAQKWAAERDHRRIMFEMPSKNLPAIRLAQKHGCEFCGYNDHYYLSQDVALFFARALK